MVPAEREESSRESDNVATEDIEASVSEIEPSACRDENGDEEGHQRGKEQVERRGGGLLARGGKAGVVRAEQAAAC